MIKVFVADDRPVVLDGLKRILAECRDMQIVGDAARREQLLGAFRAGDADVLVLDMAVTGSHTFALVQQLRKERPNVRVLVLSVSGEDRHALRLLRIGAAGYLTKDHSPDQLVAAVRKVARGGRYVDHTLVEELVLGRRGPRHRSRHDGLSDREYQVLCMFGSGQAFNKIAAELGLSPKTVSTYRSRILQKLQLTSNAALIRYAVENRLVV
jgi:DNA-binding NarL/FixJ family response regulator